MARILGPEIVGSFGYALLLIGVLSLLIDQGLGWAIVHAPAVTDDEFRIVLTRVMLAAMLCATATFIWADPIASLLGSSSAADAIRFISPAYMFIGLIVVTHAKLRKELRFREIQISQTLSYVIAYPIVGISLAVVGAGIWSLVVAWMLQAALVTVLMLRYAPHSFAFASPFRKLSFGSYSRDIASINLINWTVDHTANAFIGRVFGPAALGLYNTTLGLVRVPASHLVVNIQTVLFPSAALVKDNLPSLRKLYRTSLAAVLLIAIPAFSFVAVASEAIIAVVLGPKWSAAASMLPPVALAMIPHVISSITGSTLSGCGEQKIELASQAMIVVLLIAAYFILPLNSAVTVCWLFLGLYLIRAGFLFKAALRRLQLDWRAAVPIIRGPLIVTLLGSALYSLLAAEGSFSPYLLVAAGAVIFALIELLLLAVSPQVFMDRSVFDLLARVRTKYALLDWFLKKVDDKIAPANPDNPD